LFTWLLQRGRPLPEVMAMTFVSLVLIQFFKAYNYRSDHISVFRRPFANRWLNISIAWELALLFAILYVPFLQRAFGTFSFAPSDWAIAATLASWETDWRASTVFAYRTVTFCGRAFQNVRLAGWRACFVARGFSRRFVPVT
jgi:magnesium-transporting ATPase (P-type)